MDSKLQNRSTSSSEYFSRKFSSSNPQLNYVSPTHISSFATSNITRQTNQNVSEYQIFQPSKIMNQPERSPNFNLDERSNLKKNPFLNTNYDKMFKNKPDKVYENDYSKNTFGRSSKQVKFQSDQIDTQQRLERINTQTGQFKLEQNFRQSTAYRRSFSSQKQNFQSFTGKKSQPIKNIFNSSDLLQPITLVRNSSEKSILKQSMSESHFQNLSILDEPHKILDHIHFSIAHESDLAQLFKSFAVQEKQTIHQRFRGMVMELQNTLSQIKIAIDKKIDQTYQTLLNQLNSLKGMAEIMWKSRRGNTVSVYKNGNMNSVPKYEDILLKSTERPHSKSKSYLKFNELEMRSPESNQFLLNQLYQEDLKLGEYKMTKKLYSGQSEFERGQVDRDKLLKDMHKVSKNIATIMKQCEGMFFEQIVLEGREKKKGFNWFNYGMSEEVEQQNDCKYPQLQNINSSINDQLTQITKYVNAFRQNLKHMYLH